MRTTTPPDLTDEEIAEICRPLTQPAAQARFLKRLGVTAVRRPDRSLLVNRQHYNTVRSGAEAAAPADPAGPRWRTKA